MNVAFKKWQCRGKQPSLSEKSISVVASLSIVFGGGLLFLLGHSASRQVYDSRSDGLGADGTTHRRLLFVEAVKTPLSVDVYLFGAVRSLLEASDDVFIDVLATRANALSDFTEAFPQDPRLRVLNPHTQTRCDVLHGGYAAFDSLKDLLVDLHKRWDYSAIVFLDREAEPHERGDTIHSLLQDQAMYRSLFVLRDLKDGENEVGLQTLRWPFAATSLSALAETTQFRGTGTKACVLVAGSLGVSDDEAVRRSLSPFAEYSSTMRVLSVGSTVDLHEEFEQEVIYDLFTHKDLVGEYFSTCQAIVPVSLNALSSTCFGFHCLRILQ